MRKNLIALSAAALLASMAGSASANVFADNGAATISPTGAGALIVQPAGTGHILYVPYFNTQGTNATLLNIVNTDVTNGKALKIRFRGAANSDDIFDFQVFMSPGDVWTAKISNGPGGASSMETLDKSCTLPNSINQAFVLDRLPTQFTAAQRAAWTREGYIEILTMADVPPNAINADGSAAAGANALFTATKHVNGVAPCTAATMNTLITNPTTLAQAYGLGFRAPSGGIFANWSIVDVVNTGSYSGEATAISAVNFLDPVTLQPLPDRGNIVFFPQTGAAAPTPDLFTADPSLRTSWGAGATQVQNGSGAAYSNGALTAPIITAAMFDLPDLSTPYTLLAAYPPVAADPILQAGRLTNSLSTRVIRNEFFTDTGVNAVTDWAFSMPTRRYHVALDYRSATPGRAYTNHGMNAPLVDYFTAANTTLVPETKLLCVTSGGLSAFNREETTQTSGFVISPGTSSIFQLCGETTVLSFNAGGAAAASVLGASIARSDIDLPYRDGWVTILTPGASNNGLPVIGKAFMRANVPAGKFGLSFEHRYGR
jgi:hypothetical protein